MTELIKVMKRGRVQSGNQEKDEDPFQQEQR